MEVVGVLRPHFWGVPTNNNNKGGGECWSSMEVDEDRETPTMEDSLDEPPLTLDGGRVNQPPFLVCSSGGNLNRGGVAAPGYLESQRRELHDHLQRQSSYNQALPPLRRSFSSSNLQDRSVEALGLVYSGLASPSFRKVPLYQPLPHLPCGRR